ncbi:MAG: hypothetical protein IJ499_03340, partial [Clostridia bacterium]|nr:hypothetical protein [Clostridia bacterium]
CGGYSLELSEGAIKVFVDGEAIASLNPASALNKTTDDDEGFIPDVENTGVSFSLAEADDGYAKYIWSSSSDLWREKVYTLSCFEDRFEYAVTVKGSGRVDTVNYFLSNLADGKKLGSDHEFCQGFYPDVDLGAGDGTYLPNKSYSIYSNLSVPPMFYHSFKIAGIESCLAFAVVAEMGEHNFTGVSYDINDAKFSFSTDQYGHVTVDGEWTAPKMVIYTANDHYDAGKKYCELYFDGGICKRGDNGHKPRFWYGPIACGWFEQLAYGHSPKGNGAWMGSCKEEAHTDMLAKLKEKDLNPTILIIDDKWQEAYGTAYPHPERWPDLRSFIDNNLKNGIHTFMWYQLWNSEGLPEECLTMDYDGNSYIAGNRPVADPSHPVYQKILKENVHRIISSDEGCYNAEGFKLDFAFCQPHGRKTKTYSGKYGAELLYDYIKQIRTYAKEVKPHAVINASPCHPMFASLVDHARLHDYDPACRNCKEIFEHRAKLWGMANPYALIDTDCGGFNTHRDMMRFILNQANIGIPDLYAVSDLPTFAFSDEEWAMIREMWHNYSDKIDEMLK